MSQGQSGLHLVYKICERVCRILTVKMQESSFIIIDRISEGGNAIASVRLSVCPSSVRLFPLSLLNKLTVDIELLHTSRS